MRRSLMWESTADGREPPEQDQCAGVAHASQSHNNKPQPPSAEHLPPGDHHIVRWKSQHRPGGEKFPPATAKRVVTQEPLQLMAATAHQDSETLARTFICGPCPWRIFWFAAALQPKTL